MYLWVCVQVCGFVVCVCVCASVQVYDFVVCASVCVWQLTQGWNQAFGPGHHLVVEKEQRHKLWLLTLENMEREGRSVAPTQPASDAMRHTFTTAFDAGFAHVT